MFLTCQFPVNILLEQNLSLKKKISQKLLLNFKIWTNIKNILLYFASNFSVQGIKLYEIFFLIPDLVT